MQRLAQRRRNRQRAVAGALDEYMHEAPGGAGLDLALLRERNVSHAAERLALSQPAVSNALGRLRELLDAPLLVRLGRSMQPTPRALELEAPIRAALQQIEQSLGAGQRFDPARSTQRFRLALTDYVELICLPRLLQQLAVEAPQVSTWRPACPPRRWTRASWTWPWVVSRKCPRVSCAARG